MANLQAIAADGLTIIYLLAEGTGTDLDPYVSKFKLVDQNLLATEATLAAIANSIPEFSFDTGRLAVATGLNQPLTLTELQGLVIKTEDQNLVAFGDLFAWEGDRLKVKTELAQPLTIAQLQELIVKTQEQVPLDISTLATKANQETTNTQIGAKDETPPATDTGTSGLNGLLKRLAQRVTALIGLIGEVQTNPTQFTVLDRLKAIVTALGAVTLASESGFLTYRNTALSSTPQSVKASAGSLMGWNFINTNTVPIYVKFFNITAGSVVVGTSPVVLTILVPPGDGITPGMFLLEPGLVPFEVFSNAISIAAVTGLADNSTTAPTTPIHISVRYK